MLSEMNKKVIYYVRDWKINNVRGDVPPFEITTAQAYQLIEEFKANKCLFREPSLWSDNYIGPEFPEQLEGMKLYGTTLKLKESVLSPCCGASLTYRQCKLFCDKCGALVENCSGD